MSHHDKRIWVCLWPLCQYCQTCTHLFFLSLCLPISSLSSDSSLCRWSQCCSWSISLVSPIAKTCQTCKLQSRSCLFFQLKVASSCHQDPAFLEGIRSWKKNDSFIADMIKQRSYLYGIFFSISSGCLKKNLELQFPFVPCSTGISTANIHCVGWSHANMFCHHHGVATTSDTMYWWLIKSTTDIRFLLDLSTGLIMLSMTGHKNDMMSELFYVLCARHFLACVGLHYRSEWNVQNVCVNDN